MSIAMPFDQLDTAGQRLREAEGTITEGSAELPTDAGVYASDVLAHAAAAYGLAIGRTRDDLAEKTRRVADALAAARTDMADYEQSVVDTVTAMEAPNA